MSQLLVRLTTIALLLAAVAAAHAAPGDLDPAFPGAGKYSFGFGDNLLGARATVVQPDEKIVVLTECITGNRRLSGLVRYNPDGSRDVSFGGDGEVFTSVATTLGKNPSVSYDQPSALALQPDGKILIAGGAVIDQSTSRFFAVRYNPDGTLDTSFGTGGKISTDFVGGSETATSIALQPDGRFVLAGFQSPPSGPGYKLVIARYLTDGSLDRTFGGEGMVSTPLPNGGPSNVGVAVQSDFKVVAATSVTGFAGVAGYRIFRYDVSGQPDLTFNGNGTVFTVVGSEDFVRAVAIQPAHAATSTPEKIVVSGYTKSGASEFFTAVRCHLDGTPDASFDQDGKVMTPLPGASQVRSFGLAIDAQAFATPKIVIAGFAVFGTQAQSPLQFVAVRYNTNGSLDNTFENDGIVQTSFRGDDRGAALALAGSKFVIAGVSIVASPRQYDLAIARYHTSDGSLDSSFGDGGKKIDRIGSLRAIARGAVLQADGKIVLGGAAKQAGYDGKFALARLNADGTFDRSFGKDGRVAIGERDDGHAVALQGDGRILLAGSRATAEGDFDLALARFNADGSPDKSFFGDGVGVAPLRGTAEGGQAIAVQPDGLIVVAGYGGGSTRDTLVVRYEPGGSFDENFGFDGVVPRSFGAGDDEARAVAIQPDGKILLAGVAAGPGGKQFYVARLNHNGSPDGLFGFAGTGVVYIPFGSVDAEATSMALDSSGRIVVAGFVSNGADLDFALARLTPEGGPDLTLNGTGRVTTPISTGDDKAYALGLQADGKILVAGGAMPNVKHGSVTGPAAFGQYALVRYNSDGTPDSTYGSGGKLLVDFDLDVADIARAVVLDSTSRAVVAGEAADLFGVARLDGDAPAPPPPPTPTPVPNRFANISTRLRVESGENVLIGGFIVTGSMEKRIIIRALGPSLPVEGALANPVLELFDGNGQFVASNDNWQEAPNPQEIIDSTIAPPNEFESAILRDVPPGAYTAVVRDAADGAGVGLIEIYDLGAAQDAKLANISTRGRVLSGDNVMIGGMIVTGSSAQKVILRAIGPSLPIEGKLEDPLLELFDGNGTLLSSNNNWKDSQQSEIEATTIPPSNDLESAIVTSLPPAAYTAVVRGVNDTTGVALVEAYALE